MEVRQAMRITIAVLYGCSHDAACKLENILNARAATFEEYADLTTLNERAMWYIKTHDYESRIREYGTPYACGFFHDDTAYVDHVKARYRSPYNPALLLEKAAFQRGFTEAYHGSAEDAAVMWLTWVKAALFGVDGVYAVATFRR
jgi:hypothetical protein